MPAFLKAPGQGRGTFSWPSAWAAGENAQGSGGPTPQALGYSLPPNPDAPAVIPGAWAAVGPSVGAGRRGDVPGDTLLPPLFSVGLERLVCCCLPEGDGEKRGLGSWQHNGP